MKKITVFLLFFGIILSFVDQARTATISVQPASVVEGDDLSSLIFTFTRDTTSGTSAVNWQLTPQGTATNGVDVDDTTSSGQVSFSDGFDTAELDITVLGDTRVENNETVVITLSLPALSTDILQTTSVTGTILDDDTAFLSVAVSGSVPEGNTGTTTPANFTISTNPSDFVITVNYATVAQSATAGTDFTPVNSQATFLPGETEKLVQVFVIGDTEFEDQETFSLALSNSTNAQIDTAEVECTIDDDDTPPTVSINNVTVSESSNCTFTMTLTPPTNASVYIFLTASSGTAQIYQDFVFSSTFYQWPGTASTAQVTVQVLNDDWYEPTQSFTLIISQSNAAIGQGTATCTIIDNDPEPTFSVQGGNITEGSGGSSQNVNVYAVLSNPSEFGVTFNYSTADGTAWANTSDYYAISTQQNSIVAPDKTYPIQLTVVGDDVLEGDEYFFVQFYQVEGATVANSTARVNIFTDESVPYLTAYSTSISEPDSANSVATVIVNLTSPSSNNITVQYSVASFTATAGSDFTATPGTLVFLSGETEKSIQITVLPDTLNEIDEQAQIILFNPTNAGVTDEPFYLTIVDNDPEPTLDVSDLEVAERNAGENTTASLTVSLSTASGRIVTIDYKILNGTATLLSDYSATDGTLSFSPGTISQSIPIQIFGDDIEEPDETLRVSLFNGNGVSGNATVSVTILNDDFGSSGGSNGKDNTATIIIAVVVPFAVLGIAGVVVAVLVDRRRKQQRAEQIRLAEIEAQRSGTGTRRRVAVRRKKNASPDAKTDDEGSVLECTDSDIDSDDYISEDESNVSSESDASETSAKENNNNKAE